MTESLGGFGMAPQDVVKGYSMTQRVVLQAGWEGVNEQVESTLLDYDGDYPVEAEIVEDKARDKRTVRSTNTRLQSMLVSLARLQALERAPTLKLGKKTKIAIKAPVMVCIGVDAGQGRGEAGAWLRKGRYVKNTGVRMENQKSNTGTSGGDQKEGKMQEQKGPGETKGYSQNGVDTDKSIPVTGETGDESVEGKVEEPAGKES
ncbi:hypothetical protein NDU88_003421 [Pleurodeles waltl]|uniref:Uncharacterized protein n=1 Tax=Pleurodeles waltl TaxID=8319 RepID=A0AAV7V0M2_PLEWA|nr:hypothetical protein NDU88_003421 [Pleurodeles waltl]